MSPSTFTRVAFAAGLLASTASAAFNAASKTNVVMYWGQGSNQVPLVDVCADPNIDIVSIGFVNRFPLKRNALPGSNHANACGDQTYIDPTTGEHSFLLNCPGMEKGINLCQQNGKKVMLSVGGGFPTNYTLPTADVANWFAEFLIGAYGPVTPRWTAAGRPRPFGNAVVDGFDLDLEADTWNVPTEDLLYKNYDIFGNYVKTNSKMLLSAAPQCVVPDARIFDALKKVDFDFLFTQFYNTWECSAAKAVQDIKTKATSTFTFQTWVDWLKVNSKNKNIKLYLGLPAGTAALPPAQSSSYLVPEDANILIEKYRDNSMFGGVMVWEATVSINNKIYGQSFGTWMKYAVLGTFKNNYHPIVSSSTISSTKTSSTIKTLSTVVSSTTVSSSKLTSSIPVSSTKITSSKISSSTLVSSTKISSSTLASSTKVSSSAYVTSSAKSSSAYITSSSSSSSSSAYVSSSAHVSSSAYPVSSSASSSSSSVVVSSSSSVQVSSSVASSSAYITSSSSAYVPAPTESSSSAYVASSASSVVSSSSVSDITSSMIKPSSIASTSVTVSASSVASSSVASSSAYDASSNVVASSVASSSVHDASSSMIEPSSIVSSSAYESSSSVVVSSSVTSSSVSEATYTYTPLPTESSRSSYGYPASSPSVVYPADTTKQIYPSSVSSSSEGSSSSVYSATTPGAASSTSCSSSSGAYSTGASSSSVYPSSASSSAYVASSSSVYSEKTPEASISTAYPSMEYSASFSAVYPSGSSAVVSSVASSVYPTETYSASKGVDYPAYPAESSKSHGEYPSASSTGNIYSMTKKPEASEYPSAPTGTTSTTVVTTTYVDVCPTGLTTITTAYTHVATVTKCTKCAKPTSSAEYPEGWTTSIYTASTITLTITKPIATSTDVPAYPYSAPSMVYPADYPAAPFSSSKPAYSAPAPSMASEYLAVPEASKAAASSAAQEYPAVPAASSSAAGYPSLPIASEYPKKPVEEEVTSTIHMTLTRVPVPASTPAPYPTSAGGASYTPIHSGSAMPTGTGKPSMPSGYAPPEFEGAASRVGVGLTMLVAVVGAFMVL